MERGRSATLGEVPPASQVLPPLVQVVQVIWISGAEEAQRLLAHLRWCGAARSSAAGTWLTWAAAAPPMAAATDPMSVLLAVLLRSAGMRAWAAS